MASGSRPSEFLLSEDGSGLLTKKVGQFSRTLNREAFMLVFKSTEP